MEKSVLCPNHLINTKVTKYNSKYQCLCKIIINVIQFEPKLIIMNKLLLRAHSTKFKGRQFTHNFCYMEPKNTCIQKSSLPENCILTNERCEVSDNSCPGVRVKESPASDSLTRSDISRSAHTKQVMLFTQLENLNFLSQFVVLEHHMFCNVYKFPTNLLSWLGCVRDLGVRGVPTFFCVRIQRLNIISFIWPKPSPLRMWVVPGPSCANLLSQNRWLAVQTMKLSTLPKTELWERDEHWTPPWFGDHAQPTYGGK
jgi:hypothetical protein